MKHKGMKILAMLLTLAMVVGLLPGVGLTAYAATSHGITINNAQHGTVTASVNGSAATSAEEGATVTLTANPDNGYRLKSISGTYKGNPQETKGLNGTKTINGTYFNLSATDAAGAGWSLKNNSTITITSKDSSVKIDKVDFNIQFKGGSFNLNNVSCSAGTKSLNGNTLSVSSINGTTVTLSSSANSAGTVRFNSVTIYGKGAVDTNLTISTTGDVNVRTFTMPAVVQGDVTITPVFEEIPKYNVTLNGGANATTSGGNTTQTGVTGAMTTVTYTANSGYHFTEFANITNNGITATRTSDTVVTVSGTPTADASITIPDAVLAHTHSFTYSVDGATITATCTADGCTTPATSATLTLAAPTLTIYGQTGTDISEVATLTGLSDFNTVTGKTIAATDIKYVGRDGTSYEESTTAPTNAGKYTAKITVEEQTASVDYEIAKADPTANAPTGLTATYGQTLANVSLEGKNPEGNLPGTWAWADAATTSVGSVGVRTFKANFTPTDTTNYNSKSNVDVTVTVSKANAVAATVTANNRTYDGTEKPLVTVAGETIGGTLKIAVTTVDQEPDDGAYTFDTTSIPTATDAGTYYVWYKVAGDANHNDTEPACVTATIIPVPRITGRDLILEGTLDLRFYVYTPEGYDYGDSTMTFTIGGRGGRTATIPIAQAGTQTDGKRIFTFPVYSIEMAEDVTAVFTYKDNGETKTLTRTTTVKEYLDDLESLGNIPEKLRSLITATRNYGHYMQDYLKVLHDFTVGTGEGFDYEAMLAGSTITALTELPDDFKHNVIKRDYDRLASVGFYDSFNEGTTLNIRLEFNTTPGDVSATVNDAAWTVNPRSDTVYQVEIPNIAANNLDVPYHVTVTADGSTVYDVNVSALSYVSAVLAAGRDQEGEALALTALYNYYIAAKAYA